MWREVPMSWEEPGDRRDLATPPPEPDEAVVIRHEEEVRGVDKVWRGLGVVRARKRIETLHVDEVIPRAVEDVATERVPAGFDDSGKIETLPDGTISIPVYEEQLVVTKRIVLKERILIRKETVSERQRVRADLRKEYVELDADKGLEDRVIVDEAS
jgi:uncharacterized protein (TIGR02271 family)